MNLTLLFIEHDMDIVFNHAQLIRVMNQGALIAEGTPAEIRNNREVIKAYLGE
jgi:branched-chain amino acid transport system ATP-binding protein